MIVFSFNVLTLPEINSEKHYNTRYIDSSNLVILYRKRSFQVAVENGKRNNRIMNLENKKNKKARSYDSVCSGDSILSKMKNN